MNTDIEKEYPHADVTERIIKGFYTVYNSLGYGFLESVYEKALQYELQDGGLQVDAQTAIAVHYRGHVVGEFRADLVVNEVVIVELKAAKEMDPAFEAQLLNYLKATKVEIGLLLNFGPRPTVRRFVFDNARKHHLR
jgi:GxxExxY protein